MPPTLTGALAPASPRAPAPDTPPGAGAAERAHRRLYLPVAAKFVLAVGFALGWVGLSAWIAQPWIADLNDVLGRVLAWTIVALVAFLPGGIVAFLSTSLLMDRQPPLPTVAPTAAVTVLVAARNEERAIGRTLEGIKRSDHRGPVWVVLADNGSTDATVEVARRTAAELGLPLTVVHEPRPGKALALTTALEAVTTAYVVTVDADTVLHSEALRRLVARLESAPDDTAAVAGTVLVSNSRSNLLTRMQEWDYFLGIAAVKRMQGLYQSTLVAQGAFSLYRTDALREVGGWPDAIGEDIVLTWRLMERGGRVYVEPTSVAFTDAPDQLKHFMRQRARWARGMFEGLAAVPPWRQNRALTGAVAAIDLVIPLLDIGYVLIWVPGLVLFCLGVPLLVSVWTLAVLPITLLVYGGVRLHQSQRVFGPLGLQVRRNRLGYIAYLLGYQLLCSSASLLGYLQHLVGSRRRWK